MKVLHVSFDDSGGGAGRAAYRIHRALVDSGCESRMRVLVSGTDDGLVKAVQQQSVIFRAIQKLRREMLAYSLRNWHTDNPILHSFGRVGAGLVEELNSSDADILHLHWIANVLSIADIGRLRKPVVWTLHDMWAFCGGEHYVPDTADARFRTGYIADNRSAGERGPDMNRRAWEEKRRVWSHQRFSIVSPSRWLAGCARSSVLFGKAPIHVIPNPIATDGLWQPVLRATARTALRLPQDKRLIMMGAVSGLKNPYKGGDLLKKAIARVVASRPDDVELMIYGQQGAEKGDVWPCKVHWLGVVRDDRVLVLTNSAADVVVVPSRQDNLPNTAIEAQACGTPVVAFSTSGLTDIVIHRETGWLAKAFDTDDLAEGILWVLADEERRGRLSQLSREKAVERFAPQVIAGKYLEVYERTLAGD